VFISIIRIGDNSSIAGEVRLLALDATPFKFADEHVRLGKIEIKENCFISERTIVLPGVTIGPKVLVADGSVVNKYIPAQLLRNQSSGEGLCQV
jgi:acetyltransferase-like isoleucine patch superfamily enzyme